MKTLIATTVALVLVVSNLAWASPQPLLAGGTFLAAGETATSGAQTGSIQSGSGGALTVTEVRRVGENGKTTPIHPNHYDVKDNGSSTPEIEFKESANLKDGELVQATGTSVGSGAHTRNLKFKKKTQREKKEQDRDGKGEEVKTGEG